MDYIQIISEIYQKEKARIAMDKIVGCIVIGVMVAFVNNVAMDTIFKNNIGRLYAQQIKRGVSLWNQLCMWFARPYITVHKCLFTIVQIFCLTGFMITCYGIMILIPCKLPQLMDSYADLVIIFGGILLVIGLHLVFFASIIDYSSILSDENEAVDKKKDEILESDLYSKSSSGYEINHDQKRRWVLGPEDETIPQPSRVVQHSETLQRLELWIINLEKRIKENTWEYDTTVNEEMDDLYDRFSQLERRLFEIGAIESDVNLYCCGYWVFPDIYLKYIKKQQFQFKDKTLRQQKKCLKNMQKRVVKIRYGILLACEKSKKIHYITMLQQENLENALEIYTDVVRNVNHLAIQINNQKSLQWCCKEKKYIEQCSLLLENRRRHLIGESEQKNI